MTFIFVYCRSGCNYSCLCHLHIRLTALCKIIPDRPQNQKKELRQAEKGSLKEIRWTLTNSPFLIHRSLLTLAPPQLLHRQEFSPQQISGLFDIKRSQNFRGVFCNQVPVKCLRLPQCLPSNFCMSNYGIFCSHPKLLHQNDQFTSVMAGCCYEEAVRSLCT